MSEFKKGDRVRRTDHGSKHVVQGGVYTVVEVDPYGWLTLKEDPDPRNRLGWISGNFELVTRGGPFKPGIDGEVKEAERRSAQLRSLRSLANKLGYTLVKNEQEITA